MDERELDFLEADLDRRAFLRRAGLLGAAALTAPGLLAAGAAAANEATDPREALYSAIKSKKLVVANYGGTTQKAREVAFLDSFSAKTGVEIVSVDANPALGSRQMQGLAKPTYDAFHDGGDAIFSYLKGAKVPPKLPKAVRRNDLLDKRIRDWGFQTFYIGHCTAYLPGTFKGAQPKTWADFFNTTKFPGKRGWPGPGFADATAEAALLADGVAPDKLFPLDFERANAKLRTIKDSMVFYTEFPQVQQLLTSRSVAIAFAPNGLFAALRRLGVEVEINLERAIVASNPLVTPPGAPHADAAYALADWCSDARRQSIFSTLTSYGPGVSGAFKFLTRDLLRTLPNSPGNRPVFKNEKIIGDQFADYTKANEDFFKD